MGGVNIHILKIKFDISKEISLVSDIWGTKMIDNVAIKANKLTVLKITGMLFNRIVS